MSKLYSFFGILASLLMVYSITTLYMFSDPEIANLWVTGGVFITLFYIVFVVMQRNINKLACSSRLTELKSKYAVIDSRIFNMNTEEGPEEERHREEQAELMRRKK